MGKQKYDQDLATFLANGGTKEKGAAALRKDAKKLKEAKKASKDKDAPKRPAGGAYGQFLAEKREEIKKSLPAGHSITDVAKKAGEMWKSLPADGRQKFEEAYKTAQEEYKRQMEIYVRRRWTCLCRRRQRLRRPTSAKVTLHNRGSRSEDVKIRHLGRKVWSSAKRSSPRRVRLVTRPSSRTWPRGQRSSQRAVLPRHS